MQLLNKLYWIYYAETWYVGLLAGPSLHNPALSMLSTMIAESYSQPTLSWHQVFRSSDAEMLELSWRNSSPPRWRKRWMHSCRTVMENTTSQSRYHPVATWTWITAPSRQTMERTKKQTFVVQSTTLVLALFNEFREKQKTFVDAEWIGEVAREVLWFWVQFWLFPHTESKSSLFTRRQNQNSTLWEHPISGPAGLS